MINVYQRQIWFHQRSYILNSLNCLGGGKNPPLKAERGKIWLKYKVGSCRREVNKWQCSTQTQAALGSLKTKVGWFSQDLHLHSPLSPIPPNLKAFEGISETRFPSHSQICLNLTCGLNNLWCRRTETKKKRRTGVVISHTLLYCESSAKLSLCRVRHFWTENPQGEWVLNLSQETSQYQLRFPGWSQTNRPVSARESCHFWGG